MCSSAAVHILNSGWRSPVLGQRQAVWVLVLQSAPRCPAVQWHIRITQVNNEQSGCSASEILWHSKVFSLRERYKRAHWAGSPIWTSCKWKHCIVGSLALFSDFSFLFSFALNNNYFSFSYCHCAAEGTSFLSIYRQRKRCACSMGEMGKWRGGGQCVCQNKAVKQLMFYRDLTG